MERGNEVGSGYANACLLEETDIQLSMRNQTVCCDVTFQTDHTAEFHFLSIRRNSRCHRKKILSLHPSAST